MTIRTYKCTYGEEVEIPVQAVGVLSFPEVYTKKEDMIALARMVKEANQAEYVSLPFCHTVEGEALGAEITYGDHRQGPRASKPVLENVDRILELPPIELSKGRISEVLETCEALTLQGEQVILNVSGPIGICNTLLDSTRVLKAFRKEKETIKSVFHKLGNDIISYMKAAYARGVRVISFGDSLLSVDILGPKTTEWLVLEFYGPFLKMLKEELPEDTLFLLCPKLTYALIDIGILKQEMQAADWEMPARYDNACARMAGKAGIMGISCMRNRNYYVKPDRVPILEFVKSEI